MSNDYRAPITDSVPMSRFMDGNNFSSSNRGYDFGYKAPSPKIPNMATLSGIQNFSKIPGISLLDYQIPKMSADLTDTSPKSFDFSGANPGQNSSVFNKFSGFMKGFGQAGQGLAALGSAYNAYSANKQAKKQFGFELAGMNRNLSNDSLAYNSDLMQRTRDGAMLNGFRPGDEEFAKREQVARGRFADGSQLQA